MARTMTLYLDDEAAQALDSLTRRCEDAGQNAKPGPAIKRALVSLAARESADAAGVARARAWHVRALKEAGKFFASTD